MLHSEPGNDKGDILYCFCQEKKDEENRTLTSKYHLLLERPLPPNPLSIRIFRVDESLAHDEPWITALRQAQSKLNP